MYYASHPGENVVSEYEGVRPLEGMGAPLKVRHDLRQLFARWLSRPPRPRLILGQDGVVDELSFLNLCLHYRVEYAGGLDDIATNWDASESRVVEGAPTFDELVGYGWLFFDGGRWAMQRPPLGLSSYITYPSPSTKTFLEALGKARLVAKNETPPADARAMAGRLLAEGWLDGKVPTRDPEWVAGRLWERMCPQPCAPAHVESSDAALATEAASPDWIDAEPGDVDRAFLDWVAWCDVLGVGGRWNIGWDAIQMRYAREAAHRVLGRQTIWGTWNIDTASYADVLQKTYSIPRERLHFSMLPRKAPPRTLVAQIDWLGWPEIEPLIMERVGKSSVAFAFDLLCSELETTGSGPGIVASAATLLSFTADHPMALQLLSFRVNAVPALLVDMLMDPRVAPLATKEVIKWQQQRGRETDRDAGREAKTKAFAVQDALSLLAHHLKSNALDLEEFAALVTWCYEGQTGRNEAVADSRRMVGRQLFGLVAKEIDEVQSAVLRHLIDQVSTERNVRRAQFSAVLDALGSLRKALGVDSTSVVKLYAEFACGLHLDWTDASSLSAELAARLVATALGQVSAERDAFLVPFDSAKLLREATGDDKYSVRNDIARTLRTHVCLLARAVAGWPEGEVPPELVRALQALVSRSSMEHAEKWRVGALTDRYSSRGFLGAEQDSPSQDLAAAWRRLGDRQQNALLQSLLQSDDPVLLAKLAQNLPATAKAIIHGRLRQLAPEEASKVWTWPEVQQRVTSLLAVGEYELARRHYEVTLPDLERAPPQYRLAFFVLDLQLLMKEKNWTAIDDAAVPPTMDAATTRQAENQLTFYRATSQLLRPDGQLAEARGMLQRLAAQPGAGSAYRENIFAIAIQELLGPTLHPLIGRDKTAGETLLADINAVLANDTSAARSSLAANRALLLVALQRPTDALEAMAAWRQHERTADIEFIAALATAEMGRRDDAMAILDIAIIEYGADERLVGLKNDLQSKVATSSVTSALVSVTADPMTAVRAALQQLSELPPSQVGDVLGPPGRGVRGYLVRQVSRAVASLQHMQAMLRDRKNPEDEARFEDDLNAAVREVLGAFLAVAKWDVADQSLGGITANGSAGERDAVIRVSGQEISIYEAMVCSGLNRVDTKKHFDKLFTYGVCDIYFHVTYSYAKEVKPLLDYVRQMLEHEVPVGMTYMGCETLGQPDHEISGYVATYQVDHREVAVVFLIADLHVPKPRAAPSAARADSTQVN